MPALARMRSFVLLTLLLVGLLGTSLVSTPKAEAATTGQKIATGLNVALHQIGDPYRYGAAGPAAFDCSGLLYYSYRKAGFSRFPRTSSAQYAFVRHIRKSDLRPGDFVFFHSGGRVYHAAIFVGRKNGAPVIVHSPRSGQRVTKALPWTSSWYAGTLRGR